MIPELKAGHRIKNQSQETNRVIKVSKKEKGKRRRKNFTLNTSHFTLKRTESGRRT